MSAGDTGSEFSGRVALVTGAAGEGVGGATARRLAGAGAAVAVVDVHERRTREAAEALGAQYGVPVLGCAVDVADRPGVDAVLRTIEEELGPVDYLVNNAALNVLGRLSEFDPEDWDRVIATDLTACFYLIRQLLPGMMARGRGAVVNVGSIAGFGFGSGEDPAYAVAKAGLAGLTRQTAIEAGPRGVRCNGVAPGLIQGKFLRRHAERFREQLERTPLGRFADPEDIANVIFFLLSDQARHVTGEVVNASGGIYLRP